MYQRKTRRFRYRSNGRGYQSHKNGQLQIRPNTFSNNHTRNSFRPTQSAEKLLEKYSSLAKEAMSSGDKTLSENYLQHADHFMRIIEDKNRSQNQSKVNVIDKPIEDNKNLTDSKNNNQDSELKNKD